MKKTVKLERGEMGFWSIVCPDCPLAPHLKALELEARPCISGMSTNCQGAVPLASCKHYEKDSADFTGKGKKAKGSVQCNYDKIGLTARKNLLP